MKVKDGRFYAWLEGLSDSFRFSHTEEELEEIFLAEELTNPLRCRACKGDYEEEE